MAGRDIQIPFGPDKTGGIPIDALPAEGDSSLIGDEYQSTSADHPSGAYTDPSPDSFAQPVAIQEPASRVTYASQSSLDDNGGDSNSGQFEQQGKDESGSLSNRSDVSPSNGDDYHPGGYSDEEATAQGMDEMQMSILALKDSIGQGRELKEREKDLKELQEALDADHIELADRENILANYSTLVAEQDAIIADRTQRREAAKNEMSQLTVALEQTQSQLEVLREEHALQLQPIESDLGRARAAADQAKNDERSRKSELNAAESELRKADDSEANTMAVARHQQVQAAYDEARVRSERAKEQLAQVQKAYDEARARSEQAQGPLERTIEDYKRHIESLKQDINSLGEELSAARNRRQYCDMVYQYPDETAKMRSEIEQAEALARRMTTENDALRDQLAQSKKKARKAKVAIGIVIVIIIVIIVAFVVVSNR